MDTSKDLNVYKDLAESQSGDSVGCCCPSKDETDKRTRKNGRELDFNEWAGESKVPALMSTRSALTQQRRISNICTQTINELVLVTKALHIQPAGLTEKKHKAKIFIKSPKPK